MEIKIPKTSTPSLESGGTIEAGQKLLSPEQTEYLGELKLQYPEIFISTSDNEKMAASHDIIQRAKELGVSDDNFHSVVKEVFGKEYENILGDHLDSAMYNSEIKRTKIEFSEKNQYVTAEQYHSFEAENNVKEKLQLGESKDAKILRNNMITVMGENAKDVTPENSRAHHIVGNNPETEPAKRVLEKYNIDINDPRNGIFLPPSGKSDLKGALHNGKHTDEYFNEVNQRLSGCQSKEEVEEVLDDLKKDLFNGDINLYTFGYYKK